MECRNHSNLLPNVFLARRTAKLVAAQMRRVLRITPPIGITRVAVTRASLPGR